MFVRVHRLSDRGGVILDLVLVAGIILFAAFTFALLGLSFAELLSGAGRFFGM